VTPNLISTWSQHRERYRPLGVGLGGLPKLRQHLHAPGTRGWPERQVYHKTQVVPRRGPNRFISTMYCSHWEPPAVCERRRSVNLEASIIGENQSLGGHSGRPLEYVRSLMTGRGEQWEQLWNIREHLGLSPNQCGNPILTLRDAWNLMNIHLKDCRLYRRFSRCTQAIGIPPQRMMHRLLFIIDIKIILQCPASHWTLNCSHRNMKEN